MQCPKKGNHNGDVVNKANKAKFKELMAYHEQGKIELKKAEKIPIELENWRGQKGQKYNQMLEKYVVAGYLAIFDDGGLKFPISFFEPDEQEEMQRIIFSGRNTDQMKKKNLTNLRRDVRNAFSAYRFEADFFVTNDNHLLSKKDEIEERFGLKILCLDDMVEEVSKII